MPNIRWLIAFATALLTVASTARGERFSPWRLFSTSDGLPEPGCAAITFSPQGAMLVRTLNTGRLTRLDGYAAVTSSVPDTVVGRVAESPGGRCWTVVPQGLAEFRNGVWLIHNVPQITDALSNRATFGFPPIPFLPVKQNRVIFLLPDRLMEFSDPLQGSRTLQLRGAAEAGIGEFTGLTVAHDGGLWISGTRGLTKAAGTFRDVTPDTPWREFPVPASLGVSDLRQPNEDDQGTLCVVAEAADHSGQVVVTLDNAQHWKTFPVGKENVLQAWREPDQTLWGVTRDSLWELPATATTRINNDDLSVRQFNDAAIEGDGSFWLATADGLFRHSRPLWQSPDAFKNLNLAVRCPAKDSDDRLWFLANSRLCVLSGDQLEEYPLPDLNPRVMQVARALFALKTGSLVLDAGLGRCYEFHPGPNTFAPLVATKSRKALRILGQTPDGLVWLQTTATDAVATPYALETYDGVQVRRFPTPDALLDSPATALFMSQAGDLWLSTERSVACCHAHSWTRYVSNDNTTPQGAVSFAEPADGRLWCATPDGLWEFDGHNWLVVQAGFDRINRLIRVRDGTLWLASNAGLFHYSQGAWIENGEEEGLPGLTVREIYEDPRGALWAASNRGLSRFFPDADRDPPKTFVRRLSDPNGRLYEGDSLNLWFSGVDKWKYTSPERLLYSFRLDQQEWSPYQSLNAVSFPSLTEGKHFFQVRALDRNGNRDPNPASLEFEVSLPWYEEKRLVTISALGLAAVLLSAALALNRHRQLLRSYEQVGLKVAERTRELEVANRELLHSQKMTALGTLAAGIAHDFNNILSIVKGSAQIIEGNLDNPAKIRTRVDRIKTVVEQGAGIVQAMLGFSRSSDQQPSPCNLNTIVQDTITLLGDRFLREIHVDFNPADDLPDVAVPKDLVQQILLNFIFNAADSMTERRQVELTTHLLQKPPSELALAPVPAGAYVAVSVRDSGCGIPTENLPRIFEPFFTTKALSARRGTGLGLSMVYELAKKMEAGIAVESIVNHGSTFTLIVPVPKTPAPSDGAPPISAARAIL